MEENVPKVDSEPFTYTVEEAAKMLRISRTKAYSAARTGELPVMRIGKRILILGIQFRKLLRGERWAVWDSSIVSSRGLT